MNQEQIDRISKTLDLIMDQIFVDYDRKETELNLITIMMRVDYKDFYYKHVQKILDG